MGKSSWQSRWTLWVQWLRTTGERENWLSKTVFWPHSIIYVCIQLSLFDTCIHSHCTHNKGKIMMLVSFPIITISISKGIQTSFSFKEAASAMKASIMSEMMRCNVCRLNKDAVRSLLLRWDFNQQSLHCLHSSVWRQSKVLFNDWRCDRLNKSKESILN